ncbi:3724_t:CDS:2, partial [Ambispora leptoticha]
MRALHFLEVGCGCGCSAKLPKEEFAVLREDFQALTKPEQDIFLMAQLKSMDGGAISIGRNYLENIRNHLLKNGLLPRVHVHGLPSPVRNVNRVTQSIIFLPAEMSYKSVHRDFLAGLEKDSKLRALKYDAFRKLWHQLTPYIQIMSSRTDLCDTCQQLRNDLQFKARKEEEAQDLLKKYKEHLAKAKLERNYYNKNTKLAEEHRKLVDYIYSIMKGKIPYRSIDVAAHYMHLFGIQDEAVREQLNYVLDENELLGKGPNGILSLVFDGIKQLNKGEKHLKVTCDNAGGQNKNNATIWFYLYLVIAGYYEIDCVDHVADVVKRSSIAGLNKARRYNDKEGFQYYDILSSLAAYFMKLPGMQKFQHFLFTNINPGVVKTQKTVNGPFQEFKLIKTSQFETSKVIEKIKALSFPVLVPPLMKYERQEYLYNYIRPFVRDEFKDITCPKPL